MELNKVRKEGTIPKKSEHVNTWQNRNILLAKKPVNLDKPAFI